MFLNVKPELDPMYKDAGLEMRFGATAYETDEPDENELLEGLPPVPIDRTEYANLIDFLPKLKQEVA